MLSQMGYVITLSNKTKDSDHSFTFTGNIIHWSSVKCKRITRSVLASEIYAMAHGVDIAIAIGGTIDMIMSSSTRPQPWARALYMCHQWVCCTYSRWRSRFRRTDTTRRELIRALGPASAQGGRTGRTDCCAARLVADGSTPAGRRNLPPGVVRSISPQPSVF